MVHQRDGLRIERLVTSGVFEIDGGRWTVDNNVWFVGDNTDVVVIDAAHDAQAIASAVGHRNVVAVVCTHAHNDHINAAVDLAYATQAPVLLHPADDMLWRAVHGDFPYMHLHDGQRIGFAGTEVVAIHTPGHSLGSVCLHLPDVATLFSGDTLFAGGPGATKGSYADFWTIIDSIDNNLFSLYEHTQVFPGHGPATTVGVEYADLGLWIARGY